MSSRGCEEEHAVVCEVSAMDGICDKDGDVYYKDEKDEAYCYKVSGKGSYLPESRHSRTFSRPCYGSKRCFQIIYESKDKPVRKMYAKDAVKACRDADAGEVGFVHSAQENHLVGRASLEAIWAIPWDRRFNHRCSKFGSFKGTG